MTVKLMPSALGPPATTAARADAVLEPNVASDDAAVRPDRVDEQAGRSVQPRQPIGTLPAAAMASEADLALAIDVAARLAQSADPAVAELFADAQKAVARVSRAASVEVPLRAQLATASTRQPQEVLGMLKAQGDVVTFYPADQTLKPFALTAEATAGLPKDRLLVARFTKKRIDLALPDGTAEHVPVYALRADNLAAPRARFMGVVEQVAEEWFVRDLAPPVRMLKLSQPAAATCKVGAIVDVVNSDGSVTVTEVARAGSPQARTWLVASGQKLDAVFPERCVKEAQAIEAAQPTSLADASLVDLTHVPFFAIDNGHATDIDQVMHLAQRADGGFVFSYGLADAAHYIRPGLALWDEAMQRGTSYYLPGLSIPMLPDNLSTGAISLNAHEDHRALVMRIALDPNGNVEGPVEVLRAKLRSQAQITYDGVSEWLTTGQPINTDEHGCPVPGGVMAQLPVFRALGERLLHKASERGVVEPERREMRIGFNDDQFMLHDAKASPSSQLNAQLSILVNVAGARALQQSSIPGVDVPGIFRTHDEPSEATYQTLARQIDVVVDRHGLPEAWRFHKETEQLSAWVDRIKTLPRTPRERQLGLVLQMAAVRINVSSQYQRQAGVHAGLKLDAYARFSAPMRELVGVLSHAVLFAKVALERAAAAAELSPASAVALWAPLLLGAVVKPEDIPEDRRELAISAQRLLSATPEELPALARTLAAQAQAHSEGLSSKERALVDAVFNRAMNAGNNAKVKQAQVESASLRLLFDDLFMHDLGGNPRGNPNAPKRAGVVTDVTPAKIYVQLTDPDVELRMSLEDLRRAWPGAVFHLEDEGCSLIGNDEHHQPVARVLRGAAVTVQASHHDGERLHFAIVT